MPLNWNIGKCSNVEAIKSDKEWPITNALIWLTLVVGLREISEKNAEEFWLRVNEYERINGTYLNRMEEGMERPEPFPISLAAVKARIGLYTNVSDLTAAQWRKKVADMSRQAAVSRLRSEKEEVKEQVAA